MKKTRLLAWFLLVGLFPRIGMSYEVDTHFELAKKAFAASVLEADPDVWTNLGISSMQFFPNSKNTKGDPQTLLSEGAKFEDTLDFGTRALNHFFNPVTGKPLTIFNLPLPNRTSPDWALEDGGQIDGTFALGGQDYSYRDAREYFYKALTAADKSDREKNFGLTFQTLGMVVHHIQDMAQPQHVRNDQHLELSSNTQSLLTSAFCIRGPTACVLFLGTYYAIKNPSLYEKYTNEKRGSLVYSGYGPVYSANDRSTFDTPRKFWLTDDGKGIAQYTNTNFLSAGTISTSPPTIDSANKRDFDIQHLMPGTQLRGTVSFYASTVTDRYLAAGPDNPRLNPMAVSASIFDAELKKYAPGKKTLFTLNRFNFDVAQAFLIPRAVAYSAGLINYFFRGKIDFLPDPQNSNAYVIKNLGPEAMNGTFTLYYDADTGLRYPVPGAIWNLQIPANGQVDNLTFVPPENPAPSIPDEYILVFKGDMGAEIAGTNSAGAITATVVKNPEPDLYIVNPDHHHIQRFSANGQLRTTYPTGKGDDVQEVGLSVFKENHYYNWNSTAPAPPYVGGATKNGTDFASFETPNGVANNGQMVFVTHVNATGATVSIFDMDGNPLESRPVSPTWWMEGGSVYVAANRTHFATTSNGYLYGYSIKGGQVFEVSGLDIFSQYVAMTIDRIFAVSGSQILSYTLNGDALGTILAVPPGIVGCIEATENRFYITTQSRGFRELHIYKRSVKRDSNKQILQEDYAFLKSIPLDHGFYEPQCSVDKSYMDTLYEAP